MTVNRFGLLSVFPIDHGYMGNIRNSRHIDMYKRGQHRFTTTRRDLRSGGKVLKRHANSHTNILYIPNTCIKSEIKM